MIKSTLRIPEDLHQQLTDQAVTDRRSLNAEILHLLEVALSAVPSGTQNRPGGDSASPAPLRGSGHSSRP
ncbi:Arc family DNA-binding protein [Streptomyces sp. F001]|uniref:Arc family DNA-binding protein n=1 Tax=Streptomyces sp. F001 TaxID=1510026 RepID=UPI00101E6D93|nr:Arc family DNA-binding protein [Streptomyces sp. F001]